MSILKVNGGLHRARPSLTPSSLGSSTLYLTDGYSSATVVPSDFAGLTGLRELGIWDSTQLTTVQANAYSEVTGSSNLRSTSA